VGAREFLPPCAADRSGHERAGRCDDDGWSEYAADLTRRRGTFVKVREGWTAIKIVSGANEGDYRRTEVLMREAGDKFDGIGVHHYAIPYD